MGFAKQSQEQAQKMYVLFNRDLISTDHFLEELL